ncbi:hypothetical protein, partial [Escherichia coli]
DRNRSHWSTSKTPSYTKSVSWQHHRFLCLSKKCYFNPFSSLAGDYTEVFEEKMLHFICVSREEVFY